MKIRLHLQSGAVIDTVADISRDQWRQDIGDIGRIGADVVLDMGGCLVRARAIAAVEFVEEPGGS